MPCFEWTSQKVQEFEVVEDGMLRWNLLVGFHKTFPNMLSEGWPEVHPALGNAASMVVNITNQMKNSFRRAHDWS